MQPARRAREDETFIQVVAGPVNNHLFIGVDVHFSNVCSQVQSSSASGFGLKTIIHDHNRARELEKVLAQFQAEFQKFMYLGGREGNMPAASGYISYLISLYAVLKKTSASSATAEFNQFWDRCNKILLAKAEEYATPDSRFHNFIRAGELCAQVESDILSPEQSIFGMMMKHIVSCEDLIVDIIPDIKANRKPEESKYITSRLDEKFGDAVNYVLLLTGYLLRNA